MPQPIEGLVLFDGSNMDQAQQEELGAIVAALVEHPFRFGTSEVSGSETALEVGDRYYVGHSAIKGFLRGKDTGTHLPPYPVVK